MKRSKLSNILWLRLCAFAPPVCISAYGHVRIYACSVADSLLATAEAPSQGKERHARSFPVRGFGAQSLPLRSDLWNVRQDKITENYVPQVLGRLAVS